MFTLNHRYYKPDSYNESYSSDKTVENHRKNLECILKKNSAEYLVKRLHRDLALMAQYIYSRENLNAAAVVIVQWIEKIETYLSEHKLNDPDKKNNPLAMLLHNTKGTLGSTILGYLKLYNNKAIDLESALHFTTKAINKKIKDIDNFCTKKVDALKTCEQRINMQFPNIRLNIVNIQPLLVSQSFAEVIWTIVENACQAIKDDGQIIIIQRKDRLSVVDNGPGIPAEAQRKIFTSDRYSTKGTSGIGLAIARESALSQGGDIKLVASGDQGTSFMVKLPEATST